MKPSHAARLEQLRVGLIQWNVAPLSLVGVLVYALFSMIEFYKASPCELPEWHVAAIFTFLGAIAGLLYKMYDSMQTNRGGNCDN